MTGGRGYRSAAAEGRYRTGQAIGITTYSNVFNINPVIQASDVLVFDDVHGGEHYVVDMWTVQVSADEDASLYQTMMELLRPALTNSQLQALGDPQAYSAVHLVDVEMMRTILPSVIALLDPSDSDRIKFAWRLIRNKLSACVVLASRGNIIIRPVVPPTHTHPAFYESAQRIFMSATLGSEGDLQRSFGVRTIKLLRAAHSDWGRRYLFVPEVYCLQETSWEAVGKVWANLEPKRAVLLAPSARTLLSAVGSMNDATPDTIEWLSAPDIIDSLDTFTDSENTVLAIAGRYDGLDLPDEDCRLLVMVESPSAIGELERHLRDHWKLGPILQRKERVRLIQGLGRCTRNSTDFAVVFWLGQSLADAATNRQLLSGFPPELRAELKWGLQQSQIADKSVEELVTMALGLLEDHEYRSEANKQITALIADPEPSVAALDTTGRLDVRFAAQLWDEDHEGAYKTAREIADQLNDVSLAGLRAWWWYLAGCMARRLDDDAGEKDCMNRALSCVVNSGWLRAILRMRGQSLAEKDDQQESNIEGLWDNLSRLGFAGPRFDTEMNKMTSLLLETEHTRFHEGLEILGKALGAEVTRTSEAGAPDVVWNFGGAIATIEAKTEKEVGGELSKSEVQQANGHINWVKDRLGADEDIVSAIIVSPTQQVHDAAKPHVERLWYLSPVDVRQLAEEARVFLPSVRMKFAGKQFAEIYGELAADVNQAGLGASSIMERICRAELAASI